MEPNPETLPAGPPQRKNHSIVGGVFILLAVCVFMVVMSLRQGEESIPWVHDYESGVAASRAENKPLLIAFVGDTNNSRWMKRDCYSHPDVVEFVKIFVPILIEGKEHPDLVREYEIASYPTYVIKWPDGTDSSRFGAHSTPSVFIEKLQACLDKIGPSS